MQKPVRKTEKELLGIAAKRKTLKRRETKAVPSGNMVKVSQEIGEFAAKHGVPVEQVRFARDWGYAVMVAERMETEDEKFKRIKAQEADKYRSAKWRWDDEQRRLAIEKENAAARLNQAVREAKKNEVVIKCECSCKCK
jgi:hypothetical protein